MAPIEQLRPIMVTKEAFQVDPGVATLLPIMRGLTQLFPHKLPPHILLSSDHLSRKVIMEQNSITNDKIAELFHLKNASNDVTESFIISQLKTATDVIGYISKALNFPNRQGHDEINIPDPILLRSLHQNLHREDVEPILSYQLRRQLLLAVLAARIHNRTASDKSMEFLSGLQIELNNDFFYFNKEEGALKGTTHPKTFVTTHDLLTNEVREVEQVQNLPKLEHDQKIARGRFRQVRLDDGTMVDVYSSDRKKGNVESIIKSIARVSNGPIDPVKEIEDSLGKQFVVNGDNALRDRVMDKYIMMILNKYPGTEAIVDDPGKFAPGEANRGQSKKIAYKRVKLFFNGISAPYEVICYGLKDFLNQKEDIGTMEGTGMYQGQARSLYELRRMAKVAKILFPKEFYDYDIDRTTEMQMFEIVKKLRSSKEIVMEDRT